MKKILALVLAAVMVFGMMSVTAMADSKITVNLWSFTDEIPGMMTKYLEAHPEMAEKFEVNTTIIATTDGAYQPALDAALANGEVDLYAAEAAFILKYAQGDASEYAASYADLGIDVDAALAAADIAQYTVDIGTRPSDNALVALGYQATGGVFIYRRSIAKDVLGTDDPAEVQAKLDSWDKFNAVAADAKAKGYYMTASESETFRVFSDNGTSALVDDSGKLTLNDSIKAWQAQAKDFSDKGYTLTTGIWDDECTAQMFKDGKTMCYFGPAWYFNFSMGNAQDPEKGCPGDWAICQGPQAHFWGGTWLLAATGSDNPTMLADIMDTFINDEEVCENLIKNESQFTNNQAVNAKFAADPDYGNAFLGGQNDVAVFVDLAKNIKFENKTIYDQLLCEGLQTYWREYCDGAVTEEEAMANYYKYINEKYPEIVTP